MARRGKAIGKAFGRSPTHHEPHHPERHILQMRRREEFFVTRLSSGDPGNPQDLAPAHCGHLISFRESDKSESGQPIRNCKE